MSSRLWILGASDPEMQAIESLLLAAGEAFVCAVGPDGNRVHPGNAYRAACPETNDNGEHLIFVECFPEKLTVGPSVTVTVIDHHRPGDPGYGKPPAEFLPASSVGQVVAFLCRAAKFGNRNGGLGPAYVPAGTIEEAEWYGSLLWRAATAAPSPGGVVGVSMRGRARLSEADMEQHRTGGRAVPDGRPERMSLDDRRTHDYAEVTGAETSRREMRWVTVPDDIVFAAAADHCLAAAYRGECPGVDPDRLMRWRAESRATFQGRFVEEVLADVEAARLRLREAVQPRDMDGTLAADGHGRCPEYADLRGQSIPELPEAACREGIPFLSEVTDRDGRRKVVLQAAGEDLVRRFLAGEIVPGLTGVYGDPARGFAGGYMA